MNDNHFDDFQPTVVGNDVWVGQGVAIKDGVSIGDGAVIGAGAVVTKSIPPFAVAAGVPARIIRYRFDEETIRRLNVIRWWERDEQWLRANADSFRDVKAFVAEMASSTGTYPELKGLASANQDN